jgi:ATP-dependent protease ClpP protease subunit
MRIDMYKGLKIIQNSAQEAVIDIDGRIGKSSWWDDEDKDKENSNERIKKDLNAIKALGVSHIIVNIHSLGGDTDHALAIHDALADHPAKITTDIKGFCASSGTIIAMAGENRKMSCNGLHLSHKCSSGIRGNENDLEAELESQRAVNERIKNIYMKSGKVSKEKITELMNENNGNGKWITAKEAEEYGFVTEVYTPGESKKVACVSKHTFENSKLPSLPEGFEFLLEDEEEGKKLSKLEKILERMNNRFESFENKFNNHKTNTIMKDKFPMIVALFAIAEATAYDDKKGFNLSNDQLEKFEAELGKIAGLESEKTTLQADKTALENKVTEKETKINDLQKIVDKIPTPTTQVAGADAPDAAVETFEDEMKNSDYYKNIAKENGLKL